MSFTMFMLPSLQVRSSSVPYARCAPQRLEASAHSKRAWFLARTGYIEVSRVAHPNCRCCVDQNHLQSRIRDSRAKLRRRLPGRPDFIFHGLNAFKFERRKAATRRDETASAHSNRHAPHRSSRACLLHDPVVPDGQFDTWMHISPTEPMWRQYMLISFLGSPPLS